MTTSSSRAVRRGFVLAAAAVALGSAGLVACSSDDGGDPDLDPIAWVSPTSDAVIETGEPVPLTVKVNVPGVTRVRFELDGVEIDTCAEAPGEDCKVGALFRGATTFVSAGPHALVARADAPLGELVARLSVDVRAATGPGESPREGGAPASDAGPGDGGAPRVDAGPGDGGTTPPTGSRGFLDPDRPLHNVFGGVSWEVKGQRVLVASPPTLATSAIASCIARYRASIVKHADAFKVSRASVVATAITESNCTNPAGSSDGLSSGPMQVTGSTCASVAGGGISSATCKTRMYQNPDFSFEIGAKYMGSAYQLRQHDRDPPKIAAAYNAGSIRQSSANRWRMVVTGNHIDRFVGAYNAYRAWENLGASQRATIEAEAAALPEPTFDGAHVADETLLPSRAREGAVVFVGDLAARDGVFATFRAGRWVVDFAPVAP